MAAAQRRPLSPCSPLRGWLPSPQIFKAWFTTRTGAKVDLDPTVDDTPPPFATVLPQVRVFCTCAHASVSVRMRLCVDEVRARRGVYLG